MKLLSKRAILAAVVLCLGALGAQAQSGAKIGIFDPNKLLSNTKLGQALQDDMNRWRVGKEAELKKAGEDLDKRFQQYKASIATMSALRKDEIEAELEKARVEFQRSSADAEEELKRRRQKAFKQVADEITAALPEFAQKNAYTIILERGAVAWASPTIDVTDALVSLVNARRTTP